MLQAPRRVVIFGTSANPPTGNSGHTGIVQRLTELYDEVWVLPVYQHTFAAKADLLAFEHRVAMCELSFASVAGPTGRVKVKRVEEELATLLGTADASVPHGSLEVIRHLRRTNPHVEEWYWVLGADTYADLRAGKWKAATKAQEGERFEKEVNLLVVPRKGAAEVKLAGAATLLEMPHLQEVSSTAVRTSTDDALLQTVLHPAVLQYLREHRLYSFASLP